MDLNNEPILRGVCCDVKNCVHNNGHCCCTAETVHVNCCSGDPNHTKCDTFSEI